VPPTLVAPHRPRGQRPRANPHCTDHALRLRPALFASGTNLLLMPSANKSPFRGFALDFAGGGQPVVHLQAVRPKNYFPSTKSTAPVPTGPWLTEEPSRWPAMLSLRWQY
jgi:hypothetical protein